MTAGVDSLPLQYAAAEASDLELATDVYDNTAILAMGESGIAAHVAEGLRRRRLEAAQELVARWDRAT